MSRLALPSAMLVLVILAGCNGFSLSESTDVRTVTPADVPTVEPTTTPNGRLAPGVFPTRINASALAYAHARVLGSTSFTIRTNRTYYYPNGTVKGWYYTKTFVNSEPTSQRQIYSRTRYSQSYLNHSDIFSLTMYEEWYTSGHTYQRFTLANNTTEYRVRPPTGTEPFLSTQAWMIEDVLLSGEMQVTPHDRNGSTYYRIEGPAAPQSAVLDDRNNTSHWLLVDSRGVVREYHSNSTVTESDGTPLRLYISRSYVRIGNTTVERPSWVDTARNRTTPRTERRS